MVFLFRANDPPHWNRDKSKLNQQLDLDKNQINNKYKASEKYPSNAALVENADHLNNLKTLFHLIYLFFKIVLEKLKHAKAVWLLFQQTICTSVPLRKHFTVKAVFVFRRAQPVRYDVDSTSWMKIHFDFADSLLATSWRGFLPLDNFSQGNSDMTNPVKIEIWLENWLVIVFCFYLILCMRLH